MANCALCRLKMNTKKLKSINYPNLAFFNLRICHYCQQLIDPSSAHIASKFLQNYLTPCSYFIFGLENRDPISKLLHEFKYHRNSVFGKILTTALVQNIHSFYFDQPFPEIIVPLPSSKKRFLQRGYSQTHMIAHWISQHFKIPIVPLLQCEKSIDQQSKLNMIERKQNMIGAFSINQNKIMPLNKLTRIAIIDDVVTTGATVNSALQLLDTMLNPIQLDVWSLLYTPHVK